MLNPFDLKAALLAKRAQHVVLIHFPIALYLSGTLFDFVARVFRKPNFREVAGWNFLFASVMNIPTAATGIHAWRSVLEGQRLQGILRLHLLLGCAVDFALWLTVWLGSRLRAQAETGHSMAILATELIVCAMVSLTAQLGGFLERREWRPVNSRFEATVSARSTTYNMLILLQLRTLSA
jgi:uncharacterized membrane protein